MKEIDEKLQCAVKYAYENVESYYNKMKKMGVKPSDIKGRENFNSLPFMDKNDFRDNYPYGLFAVPLEKMIRIHSTSGTTGIPTIVGFTENDLRKQAILTEYIGRLAGIEKGDIVQIVYGFGMFTGGIGWLEGLRSLGALVIPSGAGNTDKQLQYLKQLGTTVLIGTPSYILYLAECAKNNNLNIEKDLRVRKILVGGEILTENMRSIIKSLWHVDNVTQNYGFCEGGGAGISGECLEQDGMHITDGYYPEIIDSVTGRVLPLNQRGELVFTALEKEGVPLIRYRTHDIAYLTYGKCFCGIEGYKMSRILGRSDDMLKIKGVCVFPSNIEEIILSNPLCSSNYELILETKDYLDELTIKIELNDNLSSYDNYVLYCQAEELKKRIKSQLGINANVIFSEIGELERFEGKAKRVKDLRLCRRE